MAAHGGPRDERPDLSLADRDRMWWLSFVDRLARDEQGVIGLGRQFRRNLPLYLTGAVMLLGQQLLMAKRDFLVKEAVDAVGADKGDAAAHAAVMILVVSLGAFVARVLSRVTVFTGGRNVEYELRGALLAHLHRLGPSFFGKVATGDIMSRSTSDLQQVRLLLGFGVLGVLGSLFGLASALYVMLSISGRLTLASLTMVPPLLLVTRWFSSQMFSKNRDNQEAIGKMSERVLASLAGVRVVRSFAMEEAEIAAFEQCNRDYLDKSLSLAKLRGSMFPVMGAVSAAGILVVFWYGGTLLVRDPGFTTGDFVAFWLALLRLVWPMMAIGFVVAIVQRGRAGYERLQAIFDVEPDVHDGAEPAPSLVRGAVRVEGLSFSYGEREVLHDVSLSVPAGGSLAVVGRTGSGKSTLCALLPRLLSTAPGTVFLDDHDVCDLPVAIVRASIGYAQQDAFLFSTTVEENIAYALDGVAESRDLIEAAAREAHVLAEIEQLAQGFSTVVGERGVQLSGGQKQRISLARALIRQPPVLVLDDPLSAVDAKTEAAILEAIERQKQERTVILVTHRIAAARRCDRVVVLERGRVIESGSHDELIDAGGVYSLFAEEQRIEEDLAAISARSRPLAEALQP